MVFIKLQKRIQDKSTLDKALTLKEELKSIKQVDTYIDNAINKHGFDAFDYEIIEELEPIQEVLDERERYWIKEYKSFLDPNHYNLESGSKKRV